MIDHLRSNVYCRLAPSSVDGIGIFAVRDIPADVFPCSCFGDDASPACVDVSESELRNARVDGAVQHIVRQFFFAWNEDREEGGGAGVDEAIKGGKTYPVADPNRMPLEFYVNHSAMNANVEFRACANHTRCAFDHLCTLREIKVGEELLLDYSKADCPFDDKNV